ncbi:MAG: hypothetical protein WC397_01340 [Candidatus Paceibacterota bacterium]|jgi:hypothetical protein
MNIKLAVSIIKEGKQYIAYTPALDLSTCGKSEKQAKKRFEEAVDVFFQELIERGTLENVLADLGWKKIKTQWAPPKIISTDVQKFCVAV